MKKYYYILLLLGNQLISLQAYSQYESCGNQDVDSVYFSALPWIGNNYFLSSVSDSLIQAYEMQQIEHGSAFLGGFDSQVIWRIPIKVWLYNYDNGTGGYSDDEVQVLINALNNRFNGNYNPRSIADFHSRIQFYLDCDITKINNTAKATSFNPINLEEDVPQQFYDNYKQGYLNLHIFINPLCGLKGEGMLDVVNGLSLAEINPLQHRYS